MKFENPATLNPIDQLKVIGHPTDRIDGPQKTTGTAHYAYERHDDIADPAYGYVVGSAIAKGKMINAVRLAGEFIHHRGGAGQDFVSRLAGSLHGVGAFALRHPFDGCRQSLELLTERHRFCAEITVRILWLGRRHACLHGRANDDSRRQGSLDLHQRPPPP